jgi:hypothetical protein
MNLVGHSLKILCAVSVPNHYLQLLCCASARPLQSMCCARARLLKTFVLWQYPGNIHKFCAVLVAVHYLQIMRYVSRQLLIKNSVLFQNQATTLQPLCCAGTRLFTYKCCAVSIRGHWLTANTRLLKTTSVLWQYPNTIYSFCAVPVACHYLQLLCFAICRLLIISLCSASNRPLFTTSVLCQTPDY